MPSILTAYGWTKQMPLGSGGVYYGRLSSASCGLQSAVSPALGGHAALHECAYDSSQCDLQLKNRAVQAGGEARPEGPPAMKREIRQQRRREKPRSLQKPKIRPTKMSAKALK